MLSPAASTTTATAANRRPNGVASRRRARVPSPPIRPAEPLPESLSLGRRGHAGSRRLPRACLAAAPKSRSSREPSLPLAHSFRSSELPPPSMPLRCLRGATTPRLRAVLLV
ncbi:hypothetical protein Syun_025638 [Stephania yunnanensis]|uniref:Uncharacterized protein n=1 Tax=Stephania yunnanensis TaxID=152371 RepID=A0AAP0HRF8_9MAGN